MTIGEKIKLARSLVGMTSKELAFYLVYLKDKLGNTKSTLEFLEKGN